MHFDFPAIMVLAVFSTGLIWAIDAWLWAPKRREQVAALQTAGDKQLTGKRLEEETKKLSKEPILVEYSRSLFPVILIVLILRSFLVEPFRIPSGSMIPTLLVGDFILVNKFAYGVRLPVINTKVINIGAPKRGDVAVFRFPDDPSVDYIKRVIGLPGDRISYYNKQVYVNGEKIEVSDRQAYEGNSYDVGGSSALRYTENLKGVKHQILINTNRGSANNDYVVPQGQFFVMGDNRDNSNDSRMWGYVPEGNLVGRAFMVWMNWDNNSNSVTWSRIGNSIE